MRNKGFTLLELLVVIAIIGILVAVVVVALDDSRRTSRNTAVLSQMYEYRKALELHYTNTGSYPATNALRTHRYCFGDGLVNGIDCIAPLLPIITKLPQRGLWWHYAPISRPYHALDKPKVPLIGLLQLIAAA